MNRWFQDTGVHAAYYFLCFAAPILFTFAAGAAFYRPAIPHALALAGIVGVPFLYSDVVKGNSYDNVWLIFNQPDKRSFCCLDYFGAGRVTGVDLLCFNLARVR